MRIFNIQRPAPHLSEALQAKIDNLNKPKGSLGRLEELAFQIGLIQQTLSPALRHPCHLLLGGDHGIERESVSVSPREVTWQQMINFSRGGGGVNMFCRQHRFDLTIVDMGVDYDLTPYPDILNCKVARGTRNFLHESAMSCEQLDRAIDCGAMLVDRCVEKGCNIISIGEMGIANTSPSSIWMSLLGHIPLDECIGAGAGLDAKSIEHKRIVLQKAVDNFHRCYTPFPPMSSTGGRNHPPFRRLRDGWRHRCHAPRCRAPSHGVGRRFHHGGMCIGRHTPLSGQPSLHDFRPLRRRERPPQDALPHAGPAAVAVGHETGRRDGRTLCLPHHRVGDTHDQRDEQL